VRRQGRRDPAKEQFWRKALARFATSGQTRSTFCAAEGFALHTFKYWDRKIMERDALQQSKQIRAAELIAQSFVPVLVPGMNDEPQQEHSKPVVELVFTGGSAFLFKGVDLATLRILLLAIRETAS